MPKFLLPYYEKIAILDTFYYYFLSELKRHGSSCLITVGGNTVKANRNHKSSVFTLLFNEPDRLRELYNALAGTNYDESARIVINTLEDALFMDQNNDVSFTINDKLVILVEHQSSINKNMALRLLLYIARIYEKLIDFKKIYSKNAIIIPRPEFIVLYNGPDEYPTESMMKLSDCFENVESHDTIALELQLRVYNINKGRNPKLEQQSKSLNGYAGFIAKVRENELTGLAREDALKQAVNWCIRHGVLPDFLKLHGSEVINMLIGEWNWDDAREVWHEEGVAEEREKAYQEKLEIARRMKVRGTPLDYIAEDTGLPLETVEKL
jgi:predicted transposase/invertase (TIGR01784 family)